MALRAACCGLENTRIHTLRSNLLRVVTLGRFVTEQKVISHVTPAELRRVLPDPEV